MKGLASRSDEPLALRVNDACRALSIGRTSLYRLISEERLRPITLAGRVLIPRSQLNALLETAEANCQPLPGQAA